MDLIIRLLIAHMLGDYFFQTDKCCEKKILHNVKGMGYLLLHSFIVAAVSYVMVSDWKCWIIPLSIMLSHLLIDFIKSWFKSSSPLVYLIDQLAHIFVIVAIGFYFTAGSPINDVEPSTEHLLYLLSYLLILKPTSIFTKLFIQQWAPTDILNGSLPNAGKWIGYLERLLILTFIYSNHFEGIGFLLAAKSIFRFGDLNKAKNVRTTEYVLLGTLMSFAISILIGFSVVHLAGVFCH